jgi:gamma-glutamyltranspeptidase
VDGIPIPNAGGIYQDKLAAIQPGGRLSSDMAPVIVTRHSPVLAVATVGPSLVQETVRVVASILLRTDETLQNVMAAPPLLLNIDAPKDPLAPRPVPVPQKGYDDSFLAELDKAGIPITQLPAERVLAFKGTAAAGLIDTATGRLRGVEVPGVVVFVETY